MEKEVKETRRQRDAKRVNKRGERKNSLQKLESQKERQRQRERGGGNETVTERMAEIEKHRERRTERKERKYVFTGYKHKGILFKIQSGL